jgi:hypothetical protein
MDLFGWFRVGRFIIIIIIFATFLTRIEDNWEVVEYSPEEENKERLLLERYQQLLREKELNEQKRREEKERRERLREDLFPARATKGDDNDGDDDDGFRIPTVPVHQQHSISQPSQPSNLSSSQSAKRVNNTNSNDGIGANSNAQVAPKLSVPVNKAGFLKKFGKPSEFIQSPKKRFFILGTLSSSLSFFTIFFFFSDFHFPRVSLVALPPRREIA